MLLNGDIVNLDVSLYHEGFHGDINETYYVGTKALADRDSSASSKQLGNVCMKLSNSSSQAWLSKTQEQ